MNRISHVKSICQIAICAALYVVVNYAFAFMSFGNLQFRISEMLVLLVFYNRKYAISVVLGCVIANVGSPLGWIDIVVGSGSTLLACLMMMPIKRNIWIASLMPTITCLLVAWELSYVLGTPFWYNIVTVLPCEFAVVTVVGVPVMKLLNRNKQVVQLLGLRRVGKVVITPPIEVIVSNNDNADHIMIIDKAGKTDVLVDNADSVNAPIEPTIKTDI